MICFQKTLSIGNIGFNIVSDREFILSERCTAFLKELDHPDVTIHLTQGTKDLSNYAQIYAGINFDIMQKDDELITLRYTNERKDTLAWYMEKESSDNYKITFSETLPWAYESVNPLFFFNLEEFLIEYNAIILHSAVINIHGKAIAFTAPSGTGKSTQADLWHKYKNAEILNGDRGLIRYQGDYQIYGSPYAGSSHIYVNQSAPLKAIIALKQAPYNKVRQIKGKEAYMHLISQTSLSMWNKDTVEKQSLWLSNLIASVPVYLLECLPDEAAVETLYKELEGIINE